GGSNLLWNFYQADHLEISGVGLQGSILAPHANFDFNNGNIKGTVVVDAMRGNGQLNLGPSTVQIKIPDPAALQGTVFVDVDADNKRGDPLIETGASGVEVDLTGTDSLGRHVSLSVLSDINGGFNFGTLWPGTYTVDVVPPPKYTGSVELGIPGLVAGFPAGTAHVNDVSEFTLGDGQAGTYLRLPF